MNVDPNIPLGHTIPAHRTFGWCSHCPDRTSAEELAAWQIRELRRLVDETPQPTAEAHPPHHRWYVETLDGLADEWAPGMRFTDRTEAVERYQAVSERHPLWKDGTPVRRRFVRETTSYTVEAAPAVVAQPDEETKASIVCGPSPDQCDTETGEPCDNHERAQSHVEGDHSLCRRVDCSVLRQS